MREVPRTRYARAADGVYLAYQVAGEGPDLVLVGDWTVPLEGRWDEPRMAGPLRRLSAFSRVVTFDRRGTGLSDPVALVDLSTMEHWADDLATVMDAVGIDRAVIVGAQDGGSVAQMFAATRPHRTTALVLVNSVAFVPDEADSPEPTRANQQPLVDAIDQWWGGTTYLRVTAPSLSEDRELLKRLARQVRHQASPGTARAILTMSLGTDTSGILGSIGVPTLVLHASHNPWSGVDRGRYVADHIPGATFVEVPARDQAWWTDNPHGFLDEIEHFVTGVRRGADPDRVLAIVLFTDIVDSTALAASLGDRQWREVLHAHHRAVRQELDRHRGREVKTTGDGFLATFDGPARAIRCACAVRDSVHDLELSIRAGIHTGEIEVADGDIAGLAVNVAARVCSIADANQVLVSRTVTDLVAGSAIRFNDRGEHELKGVPGSWRLFAVVD
jgi:class 3 adenylate cyclase/pimeloyl-ACP methyl ester carboxylesterase